jgi:hypothetical protein
VHGLYRFLYAVFWLSLKRKRDRILAVLQRGEDFDIIAKMKGLVA